jgi:pyrroline-5-carboxylate reductase
MAIPALPVPTWFVGCGNMGQSIVEGWRGAGIDLSSAVAIRPSGKPVTGIRTVSAYRDAGTPPAMIILGVKPQKIDEVAAELAPFLSPDAVVVSLLAGVDALSLRLRFPDVSAVVRAMPNLNVAVRRGVTALFYQGLDDSLRALLGELFAVLGYAIWAADEEKLGAIGAVAGAGPAYVARFVAALGKAGEARGLSPETAATVALETVFGTAWLAATGGETMADIARRVASPNGTTEAGLRVLDNDGALDRLIGATIDAAAARAVELAEEARPAPLAEERSVN